MNDLLRYAMGGALVANCYFIGTVNQKVIKLEQQSRFLTSWSLIQKQRADQIECALGNPFKRVDCQ